MVSDRRIVVVSGKGLPSKLGAGDFGSALLYQLDHAKSALL